MNIKNLEEALEARYIGSHASGHMGSQILRFQRDADKSALVVKFAPADNAGAMSDTEANIRGYGEIRALGGSRLVPPELQEIPVANGRALVMRDLGASMRVRDGGLAACVLLWQHFRGVIQKTTVRTDTDGGGLPLFVAEVARHIERFSSGNAFGLLGLIKKSDWVGGWRTAALMLLDFTPNNLFVSAKALWFIDPWDQDTYLGHPAVSIGQFATLMRLFRMRDADEAARMLKERCVAEMPLMLGGDAVAAGRAFRLGATLQFVLSSYVRRESDPFRSTELLTEAYKLWQEDQ